MLPFLQAKKLSSVIIAKRNKDGTSEPMQEEGEHAPELISASENLISAIHSKDATKVADALKAIQNHVNVKEKSDVE